MDRKSTTPAWISKIGPWVRRQRSKLPLNRKKSKARLTRTSSIDFSAATPPSTSTAPNPSSDFLQDSAFIAALDLTPTSRPLLALSLTLARTPNAGVDPSIDLNSNQDCGIALDKQPDTTGAETTLNL
ncbi:hypothetical protein N7478_008318 [Penicillium angulare]|uniref:uncharacterized protein n=1 Tax=Penicillium angulare TaxID=116970 RepID=UPI0025410668|nr:uncharacterized protein N7478_008318 [Penicillium angulare]KAJ5273193.1 hypothetical protein N7478_008318 [Penicillium angulare]